MIINTIVDELACELQKLPGIGYKTATRLAYALLDFSNEDRDKLSNLLQKINNNLHVCNNCGMFYTNDYCPICSDTNRDPNLLLVASDRQTIISFDNTNAYHGFYFMLNGNINPGKGRLPKTIGVDKLLDYIKKRNFKEVILALSPTIEGETTSLYISKLLSNKNIVVSKLSQGIPIGSEIEYIDEKTLLTSFKYRTNLSNTNDETAENNTIEKEDTDEF